MSVASSRFSPESRPDEPEEGGSVEDALSERMRAAREGDLTAYTELLAVLIPLLQRHIMGRRGFLQRADVEDLVQDILLSLHSVRQTYDPARPFLPWILTIAHHRLADQARRYGQRTAHESAADEATLLDIAQTHVHAEIFGDSKALRCALRKLPQRQRMAIQLLKLEEKSLKEVSAQVGTTVGALKLSVHRAMAGLRRQLVMTTPA